MSTLASHDSTRRAVEDRSCRKEDRKIESDKAKALATETKVAGS
ncbi:hypothetical protein [Dolosigranulum pigrum]|nr:hypothetical protein [Dolosigranulum pigrum]